MIAIMGTFNNNPTTKKRDGMNHKRKENKLCVDIKLRKILYHLHML